MRGVFCPAGLLLSCIKGSVWIVECCHVHRFVRTRVSMLELACGHCDRSESAEISCLGVLQGRDILIQNGMENSMFAIVWPRTV